MFSGTKWGTDQDVRVDLRAHLYPDFPLAAIEEGKVAHDHRDVPVSFVAELLCVLSGAYKCWFPPGWQVISVLNLQHNTTRRMQGITGLA